MQADQALDGESPMPRATLPRAPDEPALAAKIEHVGQIFFGNADTGVGYANHRFAVFTPRGTNGADLTTPIIGVIWSVRARLANTWREPVEVAFRHQKSL